MTEAKAAEDATSLREAAKVAWRVICDAEAVINTLDGECVLEAMNLDELRERLAASASVLFCVLRLPMSELTNPTVATPSPDPRIASLEALNERLKMEAQIHAQEAHTANATIAEIYQCVTGSTGEPGNWNGAEPVRQRIAELEAENAALRADAERYRWLRVGNYPLAFARSVLNDTPHGIDKSIAAAMKCAPLRAIDVARAGKDQK